MTVTREVILDLLPLYLAGEASPATRVLVEEYMTGDAELSKAIRSKWTENLSKVTQGGVPADLELQSLKRARKMLAWQKWMMGLGIFFTANAFSFRADFHEGKMVLFQFLLSDSPVLWGASAMLAIAFWIAYASLRRQVSVK